MARQAATEKDADVCVTGIVGCAGLVPTVEAIKARKTIALANKETLISGGPAILPLLKEYGVNVVPADSEHSAIFQSLQVRVLLLHVACVVCWSGDVTFPGNRGNRGLIQPSTPQFRSTGRAPGRAAQDHPDGLGRRLPGLGRGGPQEGDGRRRPQGQLGCQLRGLGLALLRPPFSCTAVNSF